MTKTVGMALPKVVPFAVVVLALCYSLQNQRYRQSVTVFFEGFMGTKTSSLHEREKREVSSNATEYELQLVLNISDLENFQLILNTLSFPIMINGSVEISTIETTTVCSPNVTSYQCTCEESFAWSYNSCVNHGACDAITGNTCGCIYGLPADNQYCQSNISQQVTIASTTAPAPPNDPVDFDMVLELRFPLSTVSSNVFDLIRNSLGAFTFPLNISQSLIIVNINFTTGCYPNSTGGQQCQCEDDFAWSCDKCSLYGACNDTSGQTCDCISGLPPNGEFCQPITSVSPCPTPATSTMLTTTGSPTTTTVSPTTTTASPTTTISPTTTTASPTTTTASPTTTTASPTTTTALPTTTAMPTTTTALPTTTTASPTTTTALPTTTAVPTTTTALPTTTTASPTTTTALPTTTTALPTTTTISPTTTSASPTPTTVSPTMTTTPIVPVVIDLSLDLRIPVSSAKSNIFSLVRSILQNMSFPVTFSPSLTVMNVNFTTGCYPNSTEGLQCQCENGFAWSCDKCRLYGPCNISGETCNCIKALPPNGDFCQPITDALSCLSPNDTSTTAQVTTSTTAIMTSTMAVTTSTMPVTTRTVPIMSSSITITSTSTTTTTTPTTTITTTTTTTTTTPPPTTTTTTTPPTTTTTTTTPTTTTTTTTTTTPTTTTTTTTTPTTTTTTTAVSTVERAEEFTLDMDFKNEYNNKDNEVYKDVYNAIEEKCGDAIAGCSVETLLFRSGSTIATYTLRAPVIRDPQVKEVKTGIFTELVSKYPIVFDSDTPLKLDRQKIFFGESVTVTCGPPPTDISFGSAWTAKWTLNGNSVRLDAQITKSDGASKLTIPKFFRTDNGIYECRLNKEGGSVFRQRGTFNSEETPVITINPIRKTVKCRDGNVEIKCSVSNNYQVTFQGLEGASLGPEITYDFPIPDDCSEQSEAIICQVSNTIKTFEKTIFLEFTTKEIACRDDTFGDATEGFTAEAPCEPNFEGEKTAVCRGGTYVDIQDNCILQPVNELLDQSENLDSVTLPQFLDQLSSITVNFTEEVTQSPATINAIVRILNNVANTPSSITISVISMEDVLTTTGILTTDDAKNSWNTLNQNDTRNTSLEAKNEDTETKSSSSLLLQSLETITSRLPNNSFNINTPLIILNKTDFTDSFNEEFNSSVEVDIPQSDGGTKSITVITFSSMDNVLPPRDEANSSYNIINGRVALIQSSGEINNISLTFDILNDTLGNPQCVFWNFSLFDGLGGWDDEGCSLVFNENETVSCNCNHLTSFSILMSPFFLDDLVLKYITYIGVGISMASLVICLIIEAVIWRKIRGNSTSYLRHVSIVNIAVSLLIANIWFIIGAAIANADQKNPPACTAATFFIHFFYLALFFWMLASGLLLLYRMISVFDGGLSKMAMLAIGFSLGYGAPLIIATITIAVTAPSQQYTRGNTVCWLNWDESKALLAFVIPALLIVLINLIILLIVIYKLLRRRVGASAAQSGEKHVLLVIARSLAVLTPLFGLTWALGVGTMTDPKNRGIHIAFAFFNSLQGFFILVFGTLLDSKVRSELTLKSQSSQGRTSSTSGFFSSALDRIRNIRRGGGISDFSNGLNTSSNSSGEFQTLNT